MFKFREAQANAGFSPRISSVRGTLATLSLVCGPNRGAQIGEEFLCGYQPSGHAAPNDLACLIDKEVIALGGIGVGRVVLCCDRKRAVAHKRQILERKRLAGRILRTDAVLERSLCAGQIGRDTKHLNIERVDLVIELSGFRKLGRAARSKCTRKEHQQNFLFALIVFQTNRSGAAPAAGNLEIRSHLANLRRVIRTGLRIQLSKPRNSKQERNDWNQAQRFFHKASSMGFMDSATQSASTGARLSSNRAGGLRDTSKS